MVCSDKESVVVLFACFVDHTNGLVCSGNTLDSGIVDTSVADHVGRSKVVHDKIELALSDTLRHLFTHTRSTHLRVKIVCSDLGRGNHISDLARELLLDTTVEEEGDVSIFLGLSNVTLLGILLAEPFSKHVTHVLRREGNGESVVGLVLGHGGDMDVLGIGKVGLRGAVVITQELGNLTDTIRAVVEEEESVII